MFAILLLAAGQGQRFHDAGGRTFKLLAELEPSCTVIKRTCDSLLKIGWPIYVVTGTRDSAIRQELEGMDVEFVANPDPESGLGSSIACGVRATRHMNGWLLALGDMPFIRPDSIQHVANAAKAGAEIAYPVNDGKRGHPVWFSSRFASALLSLNGDRGAQKIIEANKDVCKEIPVSDTGIFRDIDLPSDLDRPS